MNREILTLREIYGTRLPPTSLALIAALGRRPRRIIPYEDIVDRIEGMMEKDVDRPAIQHYLKRIRKVAGEIQIETHYGMGLMLVDAPHLQPERSTP